MRLRRRRRRRYSIRDTIVVAFHLHPFLNLLVQRPVEAGRELLLLRGPFLPLRRPVVVVTGGVGVVPTAFVPLPRSCLRVPFVGRCIWVLSSASKRPIILPEGRAEGPEKGGSERVERERKRKRSRLRGVKSREKKKKSSRKRKGPHHRAIISSGSTDRMKPYRCFEGEASGEGWAPGAEAEAVAALPLTAAASAAAALSAATSASRRPSWASGSIFRSVEPWAQTR